MTLRVIVEADGGSRGNPGPAGYGALVRDPESGVVLREVAAGIGVASNNVAEYRGLIAGLEAALDLGADEVEVRMDSLLVVNQMSSVWRVKHEAMKPLASEAAGLVRRLGSVRFTHVPRERNAAADRLANQAMDDAARGLAWTPRASAAAAGDAIEPSAGARTVSAASVSAAGTASGQAAGWGAPRGRSVRTLLVRHGETPLSIDKRFSGSGDPELTERGQAQARALAARLAAMGVTDVVSSPRVRAQQTAAAVAAAVGATVEVEPDLTETDFGAWEGHTFAEVQQRWPDELRRWAEDPDVAPPGGESFTATFARVRSARERVVAGHADGLLAVVAHVTPIKVLLRDALDAPMHVLFRLHLDPASLSVVDWYADGAGVVRLFNDTSHLGTELMTGGR